MLLAATISYSQNGAPENLQAVVNHDGHVVLRWETPKGELPSSYEIWRGVRSADLIIAQIYTPTAVQFTDVTVVTGTSYKYAVVAVYSANRYETAFTSITALPPPGNLRFTSIPRTTALVGEEYFYILEASGGDRKNHVYSIIGEIPEDMTVINLAGPTSYLFWVPRKVQQAHITLQVADYTTGAHAYQEFSITVADRPGTIRGFVRTNMGDPLPGSTVRFWQIGTGRNLGYQTVTDSMGYFQLNKVQAGRIYAYAQGPTNEYAPQYYINQPTIHTAWERVLIQDSTLFYDFYLMPNIGVISPVHGRVTDEQGNPVNNAKVNFIRKEDFIHIGDTTRINMLWQENSPGWRESVIDTAVFTDFNGEFIGMLPVGHDYYTVVEEDKHLRTFNSDQTNAMEARAFRVENGLRLTYTLPKAGSSQNTLMGKVYGQASGIVKQATIVLIDSELKRGAGGGHTFRKYYSTVTDTNGVFSFDNLSDSPPTALLAIPMDSRLAPQYFHSSGGRTNFIESEEIAPLGTVQNIDFHLQSVVKNGIGTFYGQVVLRQGNKRTPVPGTLIFAEREHDGSIVGYAITDSTGWYSITGLDPDNYIIYADNPEYSYNVHFSPAKPSLIMPMTMTYSRRDDINRIVELNFAIDDHRNPTDVKNLPLPATVELYQNYPNPFNPSTVIRFALPDKRHASLVVTNALGELVATLVDEALDPGFHSYLFTADKLASGVYFYQLRAGSTLISKRMMLVK